MQLQLTVSSQVQWPSKLSNGCVVYIISVMRQVSMQHTVNQRETAINGSWSAGINTAKTLAVIAQ